MALWSSSDQADIPSTKKIVERLNLSLGVMIIKIYFTIPPVSECYFDKRSSA
jgi:hypothetical protein